MKPLLNKVIRFLADDTGPTAVEYAAMLMLVFLACLSAITVLGQSTVSSFEDSSNSIEQAISPE